MFYLLQFILLFALKSFMNSEALSYQMRRFKLQIAKLHSNVHISEADPYNFYADPDPGYALSSDFSKVIHKNSACSYATKKKIIYFCKIRKNI